MLLIAVAVTAACHDTPLASNRLETQAAATPEFARSVPRSRAPAFGCRLTVSAPDGAYRHSRIALHFPATELSHDGATFRFTYRGYSDGAKLNRVMLCEVPATRPAVGSAYVRLGIEQPVPQSLSRVNSGVQASTFADEDTDMLDPLVVTTCQYGGTYPECNPKPIDPASYISDCSLYGVCGGGSAWNWGPGDGAGGGPDGSTFNDAGPFVGAVTCILAYATTGLSMLDVADKYADVILTGRAAAMAEKTYSVYVQQTNRELAIQLHLESEMTHSKQAYRDAIGDLSSAMNVSFVTAAGSAVACGVAFALPTP